MAVPTIVTKRLAARIVIQQELERMADATANVWTTPTTLAWEENVLAIRITV